jgi:hypothetical protein
MIGLHTPHMQEICTTQISFFFFFLLQISFFFVVLSGLGLVTNEGIAEMAKRAKETKLLNLCQCGGITGEVLQWLAKLPNLSILNILQCHQIEKPFVADFVQKRPDVILKSTLK